MPAARAFVGVNPISRCLSFARAAIAIVAPSGYRQLEQMSL